MRVAVRRKWKRVERKWREARMFARAMHSPWHPILAQIIPVRRCNLSCTYCNEYDKTSDPVATAAMMRRIDRLAELGTGIITFSGGEPTAAPRPRRADRQGSGTRRDRHVDYERIPADAGPHPAVKRRGSRLSADQHRQPAAGRCSVKSLKVLDRKLQWLAEHAEFEVTINSVLGSGIRNPEDAYTVPSGRGELGFNSTVGVLHDGCGQLKPLAPEHRSVFERCSTSTRVSSHSRISIRSRRTSRTACRTTGIAGPEGVSCISAKTAWFTTVRSSGQTGDPARGVHARRPAAGSAGEEGMRAVVHHQLRAPDGDARRIPREAGGDARRDSGAAEAPGSGFRAAALGQDPGMDVPRPTAAGAFWQTGASGLQYSAPRILRAVIPAIRLSSRPAVSRCRR